MSDIHFPTQLIMEILARLPVKPLLCFRSVSKSWLFIIHDPYFIKLHLKYSQKNPTNHSLIVRSGYLYSLDFPSLTEATVIEHPLKSRDYYTQIMGTCNGLLCLFNGEKQGINGAIIYNPATKMQRQLTFGRKEFGFADSVYGFGYDHVNDDYKVMRIRGDTKVFSLKANSWKTIGYFPGEYILSDKRECGIYVNGCLHWVVTRFLESIECNLIMSFDLGLEEYKIVSRPGFFAGETYMMLSVLRGCLCTCVGKYPTIECEVWLMEEYGVEDSWTKLLTLPHLPELMGEFVYVKPITLSVDGSKVLLEQGYEKFVWFDLSAQKAEIVAVSGLSDMSAAYKVVESLVPLTTRRRKRVKNTSNSAQDDVTATRKGVYFELIDGEYCRVIE